MMHLFLSNTACLLMCRLVGVECNKFWLDYYLFIYFWTKNKLTI